jgi:hypothetical protein
MEPEYSSMIAIMDLDRKHEMLISSVFQIGLLFQIKHSKKEDMNSRREQKLRE